MTNATVTDPAVLAARTPSDLAMYLRSQQWRLDARNGIAARWRRSSATTSSRSRSRWTPIRFGRDHFAVLESAAAGLRARSAEEDLPG
ncbi:MAG TPA: hypothetical protein VGP57_05660 [Actinoplanes sp.]|nr:hypothetical protein [Actinoplanes sp.]